MSCQQHASETENLAPAIMLVYHVMY